MFEIIKPDVMPEPADTDPIIKIIANPVNFNMLNVSLSLT